MPLYRPSLTELAERALADLETRLPGADARLRRSALEVLAKTQSGAVHGLYGAIDYLSRQIFADTAEAEFLARHAGLWGVVRKPAAPASGTVTFAGNAGALVPAGTLLRRGDGALYVSAADAVLAGTPATATATVTATTPGAAGNGAAGVKLTLASPVAGVQSQASVAAPGLTAGSDPETDASLLGRLLARIRQPPHGGAAFDYVSWALQVPGVTRAWVYPGHQGLGTVGLTFVRDDDVAGLIPDAAEVAAVQAHIDAERPVTAEVTVFAPLAIPVDFTIRLVPNTAAVRAAVTAELTDLLRRESVPGGTLYLSRIREAVSIAAGESDNNVTAPAADVVRALGELATIGAFTWI